MSWVPVPGYEHVTDLNDQPRKLTEKEIEYIIAHFPFPPSSDITAATVARNGVINWMVGLLRDIVLSPSAIPELIDMIIEQHFKSLITPGTPVGITAGEAVGASTTQMTLNSVAPWERILIQDMAGNSHLLKIGEWIDQLLEYNINNIKYIPENRTQYLELLYPVNIATPHDNGKITWERITAVTRHLPVGDLVKIKTRSGREVTVTQSKSLLLWDGIKLIQKEGKDAKINDLVPVIMELSDPPIIHNYIDLRKFLSPKEWLYCSELIKLYNDYMEYKAPGKNKFWTTKSRLDNLPYNRGDSALIACRNGLDKQLLKNDCLYPKNWGGSINTKIPEFFPLDKEFGQIIGLYLSEGWATDTFIGISNNAPEIQQLVYNWCNRYGITYHTVITKSVRGTSTDIKIHSVLFARWFKKWMNTGSANKIIPPEILLGNKNFIIGVLDGYFAGDGTVNKRDSYLTISSASKDLITGFGFLCSRIGIFGKMSDKALCRFDHSTGIFDFGKQSGHQPKSNNIGSSRIHYVNTYSIRNKNAVIWSNVVGSCHNAKQELMNQIELKLKNNTEWGIYYKKQNNVILDPIVSIDMIPATEYVYDLTVPTTTNFSIWNGLGISDTFHQSGSSKSASFGIQDMRSLIFASKNPPNESCTIYLTNKQITLEEAINLRQSIVGSVVSNFIKDYDIDHPRNLKSYWWHAATELLLQKQVPPSTKVLRLFLNINEMFKHKVTIAELAAVLEREIPPSAISIYGPIGDGIIDLYPYPAIIADTLKGKERIEPTLAELTYLESIVLPELKNIRVKGISGIKEIYPIISPVWRMVLLQRKFTDKDLENIITDFQENKNLEQTIPNEETRNIINSLQQNLQSLWILYYNKDIMKTTGISPQNLTALCNFAGLNAIVRRPNSLIVSMPYDRFRTKNGETIFNIDNKMYKKINPNSIIQLEGINYKEILETLVKETETGWTYEIDTGVVENLLPEQIRKIENKTYLRIDVNQLNRIGEDLFEEIDTNKIKIKEIKPNEYISDKVNQDKRVVRAEIKRLTDINIAAAQGLPENQRIALIRKPVNVPRTQLMKAAEFVILETDGSNLKELLALPGVDKTRTTCNNMYTIAATLGIEATRTFLIRALTNTISNTGSYVHPAHILLIAEFITSRGEPYGATFTGISRQPGGHLSLATLERAGEVFTRSALHGKKEDSRGSSAAVALGARIAIGSGAFDIAQNIKINGVQKTIINDDLFDALKNDDDTKTLIEEIKTRRGTETETTFENELEDLKLAQVGAVARTGNIFDYTGAENETTLLDLFTPGEAIADIGLNRITQPVNPIKAVRRVQPQTINQPVIAGDLVDVISQINIGIPLPETTERITISPLEGGVVPQEQVPEPIISKGLIPFEELYPKIVDEGIPDELQALIGQYETPEQLGQRQLPDITIVNDLPQIEVPELPDISGINLARDIIGLRKEEINYLEPIDINALQNALGEK